MEVTSSADLDIHVVHETLQISLAAIAAFSAVVAFILAIYMYRKRRCQLKKSESHETHPLTPSISGENEYPNASKSHRYPGGDSEASVDRALRPTTVSYSHLTEVLDLGSKTGNGPSITLGKIVVLDYVTPRLVYATCTAVASTNTHILDDVNTLLKIFKGADFQNHIFISILGKILPNCTHAYCNHFA